MFFHHSRLAGLHKYSDLALLLLRAAVAATFLYHGLQKWGMWSATPEDMSTTMLAIMRILSIVEPLAGIALLLGYMTRGAALALAIVMLGAIFMKLMGEPIAYSRREFDVVLLAANLVLVTLGGGKMGMDKGR